MNARPLTAALLRRLGEAADGYRTGRPIYVVACYDDPRDALCVFEREADALEHLARAGDRFGMFGPFATPVDGSASRTLVGEASLDVPATSAPAGEVVEVTLSLRDDAGEERTIRLDGREHDALFWSMSAIDKFAVPYYARTDGPEYAVEMRRQTMRAQGPVITHLPRSEYIPELDGEDLDDGTPAASLRVDSVTLTIREGGATREVRLDGREHDSVFWSMSAIDKFAIPYYARTDGAEYAAQLRRDVLASPVHALVHMPDTMSLTLESIAARAADAATASRPEPVAA